MVSAKKNNRAVDVDSRHPLAGKRIVITRARAQGSGLARRIEDLGGEVVEFPTIEIQPPESFAALDGAIGKIKTYDWLMFTSVNGVEYFLDRLQRLHKSTTELKGIKVAAIGPETVKRLEAAGVEGCLVPKQYQAEGMLEILMPETMRGKRVLIPRAAKARDILPETLRQWRAQVDVVEAYRTMIPLTDSGWFKDLLRSGGVDMITFTSSSTVSHFIRLFPGRDLAQVLAGVAIACIGPITQQTVEELGGRAAVVAKEFTILGLVQAMVAFFACQANPDRSDMPKRPTA
jgi:uroporphyrinogen III methyltransferase/synthase